MSLTIALLPGDGIGPEITRHAQRILEFLLQDEARAGKVAQMTGVSDPYTREEEDAFEFICRHTLLRPRDLMTIGERVAALGVYVAITVWGERGPTIEITTLPGPMAASSDARS